MNDADSVHLFSLSSAIKFLRSINNPVVISIKFPEKIFYFWFKFAIEGGECVCDGVSEVFQPILIDILCRMMLTQTKVPSIVNHFPATREATGEKQS